MATKKKKPESTYWNNKGRYKKALDTLYAMVPPAGAVANAKDNPALERFRVALNCYYDLYNNGLCNSPTRFRSVFGFDGVRIIRSDFSDRELIARLDAAMDQIIREAAIEQGVRLR